MTNTFKATIVITLSWALTGCGFAYKKELIDNYFLTAADAGEQMALSYNNDEAEHNYTHIVLATVFDAKWNDRFIVVKTHPANIKESLTMIYRNSRFKGGILDKVNTKGYYTQLEWDEIHKVDSMAEKDADETLKANNFLNAAKEKVTLYYLLDTKNQNQEPLLYLTEKELTSALQEKLVGSLSNNEYFEDLDK